MNTYENIDEYISNFPEDVQKILNKIRNTIKKTSPKSIEAISYGIPTFKLNGKNLVHFAGYKKHIGFYPTSFPMSFFKKELSKYKCSKGTIQFQIDEPVPFDLIVKITEYRIGEILNNN